MLIALILAIALIAFIGGLWLGVHLGLNDFRTKMKIALLKEENARIKFVLNLQKLDRKLAKV